jgi:hypothetical protein
MRLARLATVTDDSRTMPSPGLASRRLPTSLACTSGLSVIAALLPTLELIAIVKLFLQEHRTRHEFGKLSIRYRGRKHARGLEAKVIVLLGYS